MQKLELSHSLARETNLFVKSKPQKPIEILEMRKKNKKDCWHFNPPQSLSLSLKSYFVRSNYRANIVIFHYTPNLICSFTIS